MVLISEKVTCIGIGKEKDLCLPRSTLKPAGCLPSTTVKCLVGSDGSSPLLFEWEELVVKHEKFENVLTFKMFIAIIVILMGFLSASYSSKGKMTFRDSKKLFKFFHIKNCILNYMESRIFCFLGGGSSSPYKSVFCWPVLLPSGPKTMCKIFPNLFFLPKKKVLHKERGPFFYPDVERKQKLPSKICLFGLRIIFSWLFLRNCKHRRWSENQV